MTRSFVCRSYLYLLFFSSLVRLWNQMCTDDFITLNVKTKLIQAINKFPFMTMTKLYTDRNVSHTYTYLHSNTHIHTFTNSLTHKPYHNLTKRTKFKYKNWIGINKWMKLEISNIKQNNIVCTVTNTTAFINSSIMEGKKYI